MPTYTFNCPMCKRSIDKRMTYEDSKKSIVYCSNHKSTLIAMKKQEFYPISHRWKSGAKPV